MKKSNILKVKFSDDDAKKLSFVAKKEGMSIEKLIVFLARQKISYFERTKGTIKDFSDIDLSEFETFE